MDSLCRHDMTIQLYICCHTVHLKSWALDPLKCSTGWYWPTSGQHSLWSRAKVIQLVKVKILDDHKIFILRDNQDIKTAFLSNGFNVHISQLLYTGHYVDAYPSQRFELILQFWAQSPVSSFISSGPDWAGWSVATLSAYAVRSIFSQHHNI